MNPEKLVAHTSLATLTSTGPKGLRVAGRAIVYDRRPASPRLEQLFGQLPGTRHARVI